MLTLTSPFLRGCSSVPTHKGRESILFCLFLSHKVAVAKSRKIRKAFLKSLCEAGVCREVGKAMARVQRSGGMPVWAS